MEEVLFITEQEIKETTIMGGNVDRDKFLPCIHDTQIKVIEELLGSELYDKIVSDIESDDLTGDYLILFTEFVKPITKFEACADYIMISNYSLTNKGVIKNTGSEKEVAPFKEVERLAERYHSKAKMFISRFEKWIGLNYLKIPEYSNNQDGVNASNNISLTPSWFFDED